MWATKRRYLIIRVLSRSLLLVTVMLLVHLASILGVSPPSLSPVCSSRVRTEAARNSAWRLGGTRARNGLTALTAATSWLWLVKVKEDSCTYSTV